VLISISIGVLLRLAVREPSEETGNGELFNAGVGTVTLALVLVVLELNAGLSTLTSVLTLLMEWPLSLTSPVPVGLRFEVAESGSSFGGGLLMLNGKSLPLETSAPRDKDDVEELTP
jgi:hypothetical protein